MNLNLIGIMEGGKMTKHIFHDLYLDSFEYHGNTTIEVIRKQGGRTVLHDWSFLIPWKRLLSILTISTKCRRLSCLNEFLVY